MEVIFTPKYQIWKMLQFAHIISLSMHCHTRYVYCGAVLNVLVSIFLTKKPLKNMTKQHPQLGFPFTTSLHVVLLIVEFHWKAKKYVTFVNKNLSVHATSTPHCLTLSTLVKTIVRRLPTYRWHPLIYTKYHHILQKGNKNNNEEYHILM